MTEHAAAAPHPGWAARLLRAVGLAAVAAVPVTVLAIVVRSEASPVVAFDQATIRAATDLTRAHPALRQVLLGWQAAFQPGWVVLAVGAVAVLVWRRRGLRTRALWAGVTMLAGWGVGNLLKEVVRRARPVVEDAIEHAPGYSFPSGHAVNSATAAVTVTLLLRPVLGPRGRVVVPVVAGLLVLLTGADRVLLGVHNPSDVVAGWLVGATVAGASYVGFVGRAAVPTSTPAAPRTEG